MDASDVIIIGTGAGGGNMARQFAPPDKRVLLLGPRRLAPAQALLPRHAYMKNDIPVAGCAHQAGTCRFGTDPAASALNTNCRAHERNNLYVLDTSIFPSSGALNPALAAMAKALGVGDHLFTRLA
jgi:choline dehydrogenase-like flavoprotein